MEHSVYVHHPRRACLDRPSNLQRSPRRSGTPDKSGHESGDKEPCELGVEGGGVHMVGEELSLEEVGPEGRKLVRGTSLRL